MKTAAALVCLSRDRIRQSAKDEASIAARTVRLDEAERRLRGREQSAFSRHTQTMTWILAIIGTVMGLVAVAVALR